MSETSEEEEDPQVADLMAKLRARMAMREAPPPPPPPALVSGGSSDDVPLVQLIDKFKIGGNFKRQRKPKKPFEATPAVYHKGKKEPRGRTINEFEQASASEASNSSDRAFIDNSKLKKPKVRKEGSDLESSFGSNYTSNSEGEGQRRRKVRWDQSEDSSFKP